MKQLLSKSKLANNGTSISNYSLTKPLHPGTLSRRCGYESTMADATWRYSAGDGNLEETIKYTNTSNYKKSHKLEYYRR